MTPDKRLEARRARRRHRLAKALAALGPRPASRPLPVYLRQGTRRRCRPEIW
jgi:hypothetical protein